MSISFFLIKKEQEVERTLELIEFYTVPPPDGRRFVSDRTTCNTLSIQLAVFSGRYHKYHLSKMRTRYLPGHPAISRLVTEKGRAGVS